MALEQLELKGFKNIPIVQSVGKLEVRERKNPRHPIISQIMTVYGSELLFDEGLDFFDDGEDRFLLAIDLEPGYERMLLAQIEYPEDDGYRFTAGRALLVEAHYTKGSDRFLSDNFYILDLGLLNGADEKSDWINFFWERRFDKERLDELLIEEVSQESALERAKGWWILSPFEAKVIS